MAEKYSGSSVVVRSLTSSVWVEGCGGSSESRVTASFHVNTGTSELARTETFQREEERETQREVGTWKGIPVSTLRVSLRIYIYWLGFVCF